MKVSLQSWLGVCAVAAVLAVGSMASGAELVKKSASLQLGKLDEAEVAAPIGEPNYGYVGQLGTFEIAGSEGKGMIVVHSYPDTSKFALGATRLHLVGPKQIGNVDGWVYKTDWDGQQNPSKLFFSAAPTYFGGGVTEYICADYRDGSGWVWKLHPMRRMEVLTK